MDNTQDIISSILSDPDAMSQIKELGKSLGLMPDNTESLSADTQTPTQATNTAESSFQNQTTKNTLSTISDALSSLSPNLIGSLSKFLPLISNLNRDDDSSRLLGALRPFLSPQKQQRLSEAEKMLKIMRLLPMIKGSGLL